MHKHFLHLTGVPLRYTPAGEKYVENMKIKSYLKSILRIYSIIIGIIWLFFIYKVGIAMLQAIHEKQIHLIFLYLFFIGLCLAINYVAYETVSNFSKRSISDLSGITGLTMYLASHYIINKYYADSYPFLLQLLITIIPFAFGYLVYRLMKSVLVKAAIRNGDIQPPQAFDSQG